MKIEQWEHLLSTSNERQLIIRGERMALRLFHDMAERVPAYKKFLKGNRIDHRSITSIKDFANLPLLDKQNYLREYPLHELCWDGALASRQFIISATSGSTGEPFYFPRTKEQDAQYALTAELYLRTNFQIQNKRTLYVNAFPLGVWIGGLFTYSAITMIADRGQYPLSVINPGISVPSTISAIRKLAPMFDQVIIGSYAPFLKDILDEGKQQGIVWSEIELGFVFSAEGFSEEFRDYVFSHTKKKQKHTATLNHYGTVDLGTMSYETPISILLRRHILASETLRNQIFGHTYKVPTLTQYLPEQFFFEEEKGGRLVCSARSGIPLVRYDLKDLGNVLTPSEMESRANCSLEKLAQKGKISETFWKLPFVQVFERSDFSVSYYAFQIYPDTIRRALQQTDFSLVCSGKFLMRVMYDQDHNQELHINIEEYPGVHQVSALHRRKLLRAIHQQLMKESSEYQKTYAEKGDRILPILSFWEHGYPEFFAAGKKQQWIKK